MWPGWSKNWLKSFSWPIKPLGKIFWTQQQIKRRSCSVIVCPPRPHLLKSKNINIFTLQSVMVPSYPEDPVWWIASQAPRLYLSPCRRRNGQQSQPIFHRSAKRVNLKDFFVVAQLSKSSGAFVWAWTWLKDLLKLHCNCWQKWRPHGTRCPWPPAEQSMGICHCWPAQYNDHYWLFHELLSPNQKAIQGRL